MVGYKRIGQKIGSVKWIQAIYLLLEDSRRLEQKCALLHESWKVFIKVPLHQVYTVPAI
jgi:hypothetical protein